ncbi:MAG TPA: site-specific integrase, partial [Pseudomonas nitrititolerans]|nr:site-specific integrase [Stutzerimonas nitrititolerans]
MKLAAALDAYFQHLRSERQVSPHTLDGYRRDLLKVTDYCDRQQVRQWSELKAHHVRQ